MYEEPSSPHMRNKSGAPQFSQKFLHKRKLICGSLSVKQSLPQTEQQKAKIDSEYIFQFVVSSVLKHTKEERAKRKAAFHLKKMGKPGNLPACLSVTAVTAHVPRNISPSVFGTLVCRLN